MFNCIECEANKKLRKVNGCLSPAKRVVWETDYCFHCHGRDKKCPYCKGVGKIEVYRCPRVLHLDIAYLLPFYYDYKMNSRRVWPNGQGRAFQPVKLQRAFDILDKFYYDYELLKRDNKDGK
jgi:hypothetical protein